MRRRDVYAWIDPWEAIAEAEEDVHYEMDARDRDICNLRQRHEDETRHLRAIIEHQALKMMEVVNLYQPSVILTKAGR